MRSAHSSGLPVRPVYLSTSVFILVVIDFALSAVPFSIVNCLYALLPHLHTPSPACDEALLFLHARDKSNQTALRVITER